MTILPPARIFLPTDCPVIQISCGLHHTGIKPYDKMQYINLIQIVYMFL